MTRRACRAANSSRRSPRRCRRCRTASTRALAHRDANTKTIDSKDEFHAYFTAPKTARENDPTPIHGGFALTHFDGDPALEAKIKDELGVTVRCIPLAPGEPGTCPFTGKPSAKRVVWAKAY